MKNQNTVRIGSVDINERARIRALEHLRRDIRAWARARDLWLDCAFHTPHIYYDEKPGASQTLLLTTEGPLAAALGIVAYGVGTGAVFSYETEFSALLAKHGFIYEADNHYTLSLFPQDDAVMREYVALHRWQWIKANSKEQMSNLSAEVFEYFAAKPDDLRRLSWRQFEELLDAIFKNQGYFTELGSGRNDKGADLRLYQNAANPELVTVVQAKRYRTRPITLEAVAALVGVATVEEAPRMIFATTSRFLPSAKRFAETASKKLDVELADAGRVADWCAEIGQHLEKFYSQGIRHELLYVERSQQTDLVGKIVSAEYGYNCRSNAFAIIEGIFGNDVILRPIGARATTPDPNAGYEVADESAPVRWTNRARIAAKKRCEINGTSTFRAERKDFQLWDGTPKFHHAD